MNVLSSQYMYSSLKSTYKFLSVHNMYHLKYDELHTRYKAVFLKKKWTQQCTFACLQLILKYII